MVISFEWMVAFKKASDQEKKTTECTYKQKLDKQPTPRATTTVQEQARKQNTVVTGIKGQLCREGSSAVVFDSMSFPSS